MRRRGFTLFEVLIALMVVVILISTMSGTISVAFRSQAVSEQKMEGVRNTQTLGDVWVQDVECAVPPNPLSAGYDSIVYQVAATQAEADANAAMGDTSSTTGTVEASGGINGSLLQSGITIGSSYLFGPFIGDNISMSFCTAGPEPKAALEGDVRKVEYALAQQSDGRMALVRRLNTNLLTQDTSTQLAEEILVTGVTAVNFQYFDGTGWRNGWDSTSTDINNTLPTAVKMTVTLEPVRSEGPLREVSRFASVWCAAKTMSDSNNSVAASQQAADQAASGSE
jgi:prepilin-type N-terminal cleavage/methylation domain-containing protein